MSRMLPFTTEQFFSVFADYNESVWPMQWLLTLLAVGIVLLTISRTPWRDRAICLLLASLWAWMAIAYHLLHFSTINPAAYVFAGVFLVQAALFLWWTISNRALMPAFRRDLKSWIAAGILTFALILYPILSASLGHAYPFAPTFGVPCPSTIFTLGVLTAARAPRIAILFIAPLAWSVVGGSAAFLLGVWPDLGLIVSAITAAALLGFGWQKARIQL